MTCYQLFWDESERVVAAVAGTIPNWKQREWRTILDGKFLPESTVETVVEQLSTRNSDRRSQFENR